jgi:Fe-Mn family superoxide dismutase
MFILPDLPYGYDALKPVLSDELMHLHHDKHHAGYVNNVNKMLGESGRAPSSMEDLVRESAAKGEKKLFNNAGQAWNHAFFWECMTPGGGQPQGALAEAIQSAFGGLSGLKSKFVEEGATHFGSGWAWLAAEGGALKVFSTHDADTAITREGVTPILVCDVWEHAYYLDFKNDRKAFLEAWFDKIVNWRFAEAQFQAAKGGGQGYRYPAPN